MKVRITWKACADGRWRKGEDVTELPKFLEPEEIEELLNGFESGDRWAREYMPNFHDYYLCGDNPINFKILKVEEVRR